jgi:citrate lyase subunit beta/citryl-CoA lyase
VSETIRRSWLLVPLSREERITQALRSGADVVVLDVVELVAEKDKPAARERAPAALETVRQGGAEIYAQVDPELLYADLHACVWPGLSGVILSRAESPQQITEADTLLGQLEARRGIFPNTVEIVAALETARGNHAAYEISTASPRLWGVTLGRADLIMDLRPEPSGEIHLMIYLMQRLITIAGAAGVTPIGAWWRAPDRGLLATPEQTYQAARRGRAIGFQGAMCVLDNQVEALNRAFTPSAEEITAAQQILAGHMAHEVTALKQGDVIMNAGMTVQARRLLARSDACAAHEQRKMAAVQRLAAS